MNNNLANHKTKIVCTIGPSSGSIHALSELIMAGMNVARLNLSHGTLAGHKRMIQHIRSLASRLNRTTSIMIDLPGTKIRVGNLKSGSVVLKRNETVILAEGSASDNESIIPVEYEHFHDLVPEKGTVYLNDGFIQLKVQKIHRGRVTCRVVTGGLLASHKGLNIPGAKLGVSGVTGEDLRLIDIFLNQGIDMFCVSFVERMEDIQKVKRFINSRGKQASIIAKIERSNAVKHIDGILDAADGIMVARGDLGVEIPIEQVPVVQKMLIRKANMRGKVVITATQMLLSMTEHIRPTRAEVTDVANAVLDGTDAVMLSEETATGRYPVETVRMMAKIAGISERKRKEFGCLPAAGIAKNQGKDKHRAVEDVLSYDVQYAIENIRISLAVVYAGTGGIVRAISRFKPDCWIISVTGDKQAMHFLNLSYGVHPFLMQGQKTERHEDIIKKITRYGLAKSGDKILLVEGTLRKKDDHTNSLSIITI